MKTSTTSSVTYCISTGLSRDTTTPMRSRYRLRSQRKTRASQWCLRRAASHERRTAARTRLWLDGYLRWQHALGGPLREQRAQLADAVLRVCKQVRLHLVSVARGCSGEWKHGVGWLFEMEQPAPAAASSPFSAARRVPETARRGGELSASRASHRGEGSTGGARRVRWIELTALECSENRLQRETRTFFAFVISFSISSVERLRASSTAGSFICAAAAREATRVVAAETRSPLVETSASASSTRRKSDMTDTLPESPRSRKEQKGDPSRSRVFPQSGRSVNVSVLTCGVGVNYDLWLLIAGKPRVPAFPRPGMRITVNP